MPEAQSCRGPDAAWKAGRRSAASLGRASAGRDPGGSCLPRLPLSELLTAPELLLGGVTSSLIGEEAESLKVTCQAEAET